MAVKRHPTVDGSGWVAFFGGSVGAAPRKRTLRPMGMSEAGNARCGVRRVYQKKLARAGKLMIKLGPGAASVRPPTNCHSEREGGIRDDETLENISIQTRWPWPASGGPAHLRLPFFARRPGCCNVMATPWVTPTTQKKTFLGIPLVNITSQEEVWRRKAIADGQGHQTPRS